MYIYVTYITYIQVLTLLDVLDPSPEPSLEVALQACHTRLQGGTSCVAGTRRSGGGGAPDVEASRRRWIHLQFLLKLLENWQDHTDRPFIFRLRFWAGICLTADFSVRFVQRCRDTEPPGILRRLRLSAAPRHRHACRSKVTDKVAWAWYEIYEVLPEGTKRNVAT